MGQRQKTAPLLISDGSATLLNRVPFDESFKEERLQDLLFRHPQLLPVAEIEPVFDNLIPLARELPTDAGPVDVVYINSAGYLTLVETKLWRNPEARRQAVVQIVDYAKELARWTCADLLAAVCKADGGTEEALMKKLRASDEDFDEAKFHDIVTRNLRLGRFLLLIAGDGIQEGVEQLTDFLNAPQLAFTFGLVELALYRVPGAGPESLFVQPSIPARTREVVRALVDVRVENGSIVAKVDVPSDQSTVQISRSLTAEQFLEQLGQKTPSGVVDGTRWVIEHAPEYSLRIDWRKDSFALFYDDPNGEEFNFASVSVSRAGVSFWKIQQHCVRQGLPDEVWQDYLDAIVRVVPGAHREKYGEEQEGISASDGEEYLPLAVLVKSKEAWFEAIDRTIARILKTMENR